MLISLVSLRMFTKYNLLLMCDFYVKNIQNVGQNIKDIWVKRNGFALVNTDWNVGTEKSIGLIQWNQSKWPKLRKVMSQGVIIPYMVKIIQNNSEWPPNQSDSHIFIFHHWITSIQNNLCILFYKPFNIKFCQMYCANFLSWYILTCTKRKGVLISKMKG